MDYRKAIILIMEKTGVSQKELARRTGIKESNLARQMNGTGGITLTTLEKIAKALNISLSQLFSTDDADDDIVTSSILDKQVSGYLEFKGQIKRVNSLSEVKRWVSNIEKSIDAISSQYKTIIHENQKNEQKVRRTKEGYDFSNVDFYRTEVYDCSQYEIWSFRKANDEVVVGDTTIENSLGNMCGGFDCCLNGVHFHSSESAYIAGMFSNPTEEHLSIQRELMDVVSGYGAKKDVRHKYEHLKRADWETFNVEWMKYVVWTKCLENKKFQELLMSVPEDAIIVENTSFQKAKKGKDTSLFWGAKNPKLKAAVQIIEEYIDITAWNKSPKDRERRKNQERNKIRFLGEYTGVNCMGKILKMCQISLLNNTKPKIDYFLLQSKTIYLNGKLIEFDKYSI